MQRKKHYGLAYLLVLLAAIAGFFLLRERTRAVELPRVTAPAELRQLVADLDLLGLFTRLMPAVAPAPSPTPLLAARTAEPATVQGIEPTATPGAAATPAPAVAVPLPAPTALAGADYPFMPAGPLRSDNEGCAEASIRGSVRDAGGAGLAGVRLWRYDQFGNEQVVESGAGDADRGQYSFAIGDDANIHYVQVIDAGGAIISPVIQVDHRQGAAPDALCHWVDWQQR
jgi:hypothetical protein